MTPSPTDPPPERTVTRWYLEMRDRTALRPGRAPVPEPQVMRAARPLPMLNRFLYTAVGGHWHWTDRLGWSYARWMAWLDRPQLQTWVLYVDGTPAGYVELERQPGDDVEIAYFGLMREFLGRGLGGWFLGVAIDKAWALGARRVWVHTCSLDAPAALANYQARGMTIFREETYVARVPATPIGPWPGADEADAARGAAP